MKPGPIIYWSCFIYSPHLRWLLQYHFGHYGLPSSKTSLDFNSISKPILDFKEVDVITYLCTENLYRVKFTKRASYSHLSVSDCCCSADLMWSIEHNWTWTTGGMPMMPCLQCAMSRWCLCWCWWPLSHLRYSHCSHQQPQPHSSSIPPPTRSGMFLFTPPFTNVVIPIFWQIFRIWAI